jgi:hypothetical protein
MYRSLALTTNPGKNTRRILFTASVLSSITGIYEEFTELLAKIRRTISRNYETSFVNLALMPEKWRARM